MPIVLKFGIQRYFHDKKIYFSILFIFCFIVNSFALTPWTTSVKNTFTTAVVVETFDDIVDYPVTSGDNIFLTHNGINTNLNNLPKYSDGTSSPMNEYAWWDDSDPAVNWIADHRDTGGHVWLPNGGSGKSIIIDFSNQLMSTSKIGFYFGNGNRTDGLSELYVFYLVYFPQNYFPTSIVDGIGYYVDGNNYSFVASTKHAHVVIGFDGINHHADYNTYGMVDSAGTTYGWVSRLLHIIPTAPYNNPSCLGAVFQGRFNVPSITPPWINDVYEIPNNGLILDTDMTYPSNYPTGQWLAVELHYKLNTHNNQDGVFSAVYIDPYTRTSTTVVNQTNMWYNPGTLIDAGDKFNEVHFGTNNSSQWSWGNSMDPRQFIDDVIVDSQPILNKYFALVDSFSGSTPVYVQPTITIVNNITFSSSATASGTAFKDNALSYGLCTWTHSGGTVSGFATVLLDVVSGEVTGLPLGTTPVTFTLTDSNGQTAHTTALFTRTNPKTSNALHIHNSIYR